MPIVYLIHRPRGKACSSSTESEPRQAHRHGERLNSLVDIACVRHGAPKVLDAEIRLTGAFQNHGLAPGQEVHRGRKLPDRLWRNDNGAVTVGMDDGVMLDRHPVHVDRTARLHDMHVSMTGATKPASN